MPDELFDIIDERFASLVFPHAALERLRRWRG